MTDDTNRPRRSNGSFTSEYKPADFIDAITALDEPNTTEIADHVGCGIGTAHRYLNQLHENSQIAREEKYGVVIWSLPT